MEHTISHLLEMAAGKRGERAALHGATVGVATVIASLTWRRVRERLAAGGLADLRVPSNKGMARQVRAAFDPVDPSGAMSSECWSDYARKLSRWREGDEARGDFARTWSDHDKVVSTLVVEPERLVAALAEAGAPLRFADLDPAVDAETARWAIANCHLVRDRFTVADLACFVGAWSSSDVDAVLTEAAALGAGL
jgi:glycerol-1-phosphate dehydrogenase [NAD(P)+]